MVKKEKKKRKKIIYIRYSWRRKKKIGTMELEIEIIKIRENIEIIDVEG